MDELAGRLARGEKAAFAELYDVCADRLYHYLAHRLGSRDAAGDVLQETFVRLVRGHEHFAGVANPVAYVFATARNEAARLTMRRDRDRLRHARAAEDLYRAEASGDRHQNDMSAALVDALNELDPALREIVHLKIYTGLTFREIAEVTGLPQGTAATRYRTALQRLRRYLTRQCS